MADIRGHKASWWSQTEINLNKPYFCCITTLWSNPPVKLVIVTGKGDIYEVYICCASDIQLLGCLKWSGFYNKEENVGIGKFNHIPLYVSLSATDVAMVDIYIPVLCHMLLWLLHYFVVMDITSCGCDWHIILLWLPDLLLCQCTRIIINII